MHGSAARPRACVRRSLRHIGIQLIDDDTGKTLMAFSSRSLSLSEGRNKTHTAELVGSEVAKLAQAKQIKTIVFDRGGYRYHGRVKALADSMRSGGLEF